MQCDNLSVAAAIKKGAARDSTVMHLFWVPLVFVAHYDILLIPEHIPGVSNMTADHLSRCQMHHLFFYTIPRNRQPHLQFTP